ncbi:hypothetical protein C2845_PM01G23310 [Panicum miliaceum]|uniref:Uncharacterized protein n=1 Tax=Panicum miliaceum TaxID=4540 RepID=A0A3L6TJ79_PANMI|nr:hypothetical protein C2845_PM01G23310 [Panicum miliaceum]
MPKKGKKEGTKNRSKRCQGGKKSKRGKFRMFTSGIKLIVADGVADGTVVADGVAGGASVVGGIANGAAIEGMKRIVDERRIAGECGWKPRGRWEKIESDSLGRKLLSSWRRSGGEHQYLKTVQERNGKGGIFAAPSTRIPGEQLSQAPSSKRLQSSCRRPRNGRRFLSRLFWRID